jgi:hypothetical protein
MPNSLEEFVAHENIKRFEQALSTTTNNDERALLLGMLSDEKQNLLTHFPQPLSAIKRSSCQT